MHELSLFTGAGGGLLGSLLLGHTPVLAAEIAKYPLQVLHARMNDGSLPRMTIVDDVRKVDGRKLRGIGLVSGGSPCQDISPAGKKQGLEGPKSKLFWEMARVISEAEPAWVFLENSDRLRTKGLREVLFALAEMGYTDAAWGIISGAQVGAPHLRKRMWVLARRRLGVACREFPEPDSMPACGMMLGAEIRSVPNWLPSIRKADLPTLTAADSRASGNRPDPNLWTLSDILGITAKKYKHSRMLPTLAATDWKSPYSGPGLAKQLEKRSKPLRDILPWLEGGRSINPAWAEWFMGWAPGWTDIDGACPKSRVDLWRRVTKQGEWWTTDMETPFLPRTQQVGSTVPYTGNRIQALGNGQIPAAMATAFTLLKEALS